MEALLKAGLHGRMSIPPEERLLISNQAESSINAHQGDRQSGRPFSWSRLGADDTADQNHQEGADIAIAFAPASSQTLLGPVRIRVA